MEFRPPKFSIRATLLVIIGLLNIALAAQAGYNALSSWVSYHEAQDVKQSSALVYQLYTAEKFLSLERGASMAVLHAAPKDRPLLLAELRDHRAKADGAIRAVLPGLTAREEPKITVAATRVRERYAEVQALRRMTDRGLANDADNAIDSTERSLADKDFAAENDLIDSIAMLAEVYSGRHLVANASLLQRVRLARAIWSITEFTGRQYAVLGRLIVQQKTPSAEEERLLANWQGRIEGSWSAANGYIASADWGDSFRPYMEEARTQYVMTFEQIKDMFTAPPQQQRASYPVSISMWLGLSSQSLDSLYEMMDSALELNRTYVADLKADAERSIGLSLLMLACVTALSLYCWRLIMRRVIRPINLMVDALYRTTRGEPAELPAIAFGDDEIGKLATVLEAFKENGQQLQEERDKARAANIAKSEFLANMSHEIRTPMNVVLGIANILSTSRPLTERQTEFVRMLRISAESLLSIINDLLDISKIETGSFDLEQIPFVLKSVIDETALLISVKAKEKGLALEVDDQTLDGKEYIGDPTRLRQILTNLCSNAVKFTEQGRISISARSLPSAAAGLEDVFISVRDTGVGIPEDKLGVIFDKFTQADSSINRKFGGTGLGLSIAKAFAEMMHGTITVDSEKEKGTTFTVYLPLRLRRQGVRPAAAALAVSPAPAPPRDKRVLLVEDYAPNALVAGAFLEQFGYAYDVAESGHKALELAAQHHYHAILMDVQMQGMDGLQATQAIRQLEEASGAARTRIIGMTAYALPGDRDKCLAAGMDDYIAKPFNPDTLNEKLAAGSPAPSPSSPSSPSPQRQASSAVLSATGAATPKPCRVLVVDDNEDSATTLGWTVESLGHEVKVANDARSALDIAKNFAPDVVLLDIGLPETDGYQVCKLMREIPTLKDSRIIAQTGWGEAEHRDRAKEAGFTDHLVKPVTIDMLKKVLPDASSNAQKLH